MGAKTHGMREGDVMAELITQGRETVSKTHNPAPFPAADGLGEAIAFARRVYGRVGVREQRSHHAIRMFVASLALAVREARRDPESANAACKKAGIKGKRIEVRVARLVAGRRIPGRPDQTARWANCAAYLAHPPNGDEPPGSWREALRYVVRRGGVRCLSDLYAGSRPESLAERGHGIYYRRSDADPTDECLTPKYVFDCLETHFDLDPAGSAIAPWIPARIVYTHSGLERPWWGTVWLNPPYGRGVLPLWIKKFAAHRDGICLVPERTSTVWWQELVDQADLILCVNRKIPFIVSGGSTSAFPIGSTLVAIGDRAVAGLIAGHRNGLGLLLKPYHAASILAFAETPAAA
jgi:hypothetical protein